MMLSPYGKREWLTIVAAGLALAGLGLWLGWWWLAIVAVLLTAALAAFFRDPPRNTPKERGLVVSPADGRVSSVHHVEHFAPFNEPATCVRIFLSVLDVHVNRSPCHGLVASVEHKPGEHLNALNPDSAEVNESTLMVLVHPTRHTPVAAIRQLAGLLARTIVCAAKPGETLQRGQRFGLIKFGSTTELYLPQSHNPEVLVRHGQYVWGGLTVLANVRNPADTPEPAPPAEGGAQLSRSD